MTGEERRTFIEGRKANTFRRLSWSSLGFGPFRPYLDVSVDCSIVKSHQFQLSFLSVSKSSLHDEVVPRLWMLIARQVSYRRAFAHAPLAIHFLFFYFIIMQWNIKMLGKACMRLMQATFSYVYELSIEHHKKMGIFQWTKVSVIDNV